MARASLNVSARVAKSSIYYCDYYTNQLFNLLLLSGGVIYDIIIEPPSIGQVDAYCSYSNQLLL